MVCSRTNQIEETRAARAQGTVDYSARRANEAGAQVKPGRTEDIGNGILAHACGATVERTALVRLPMRHRINSKRAAR
jgi:hypothetical protein